MSKVVLEDINRSLEDFNELAKEFQVSKAEVVENLPMLREAVALFVRLRELYESVDPDSPRAKNYFDLAQSLASVNQGWQYNRDLLSSEAILADHARAPKDDRLSMEERERVRSIIGSSKLKNFVQFFDMENQEAFEVLSDVVDIETENQEVSSLSAKDRMSKRASRIVDRLIDHPSDESSEDFYDTSEDTVPEEGDTLVEYEKKESNRESQEKAIAEITETSKSIDEALREKRPAKSKKKSSTRSKKPYRPEQSWGDAFKQLAKWLAAAAATFAGVGFLSKKILDLIQQLKLSQDKMKSAVDEFTSSRKADEAKDVARWEDPEKAGAEYREALEELKKDWPTELQSISSEDIGMAQAYAADESNSKVPREVFKWVSEKFEGKSESQIGMLSAIAMGDKVYWYDSEDGKKLGVSLDPFVKSPKGQEVSDAAMAARAVDFRQIAGANQPFEMENTWFNRVFRLNKLQESRASARTLSYTSGVDALESAILSDPDKVSKYFEKIKNDEPLEDESSGIKLSIGELTPTVRMLGELFEARGKQSVFNWRERKISEAARSGDREELYKQLKRYADVYAKDAGGVVGKIFDGGSRKFLGYDISSMEAAKPLLDALMELGDYGTRGGYESYMRKHNPNYSGDTTQSPPVYTINETRVQHVVQDNSNKSEPIGEL